MGFEVPLSLFTIYMNTLWWAVMPSYTIIFGWADMLRTIASNNMGAELCSPYFCVLHYGGCYTLTTFVSYTMGAVKLSVLVSYTIWSVTLGGIL